MRTDIHSPKNFDPADYEYEGSFYNGFCGEDHERDYARSCRDRLASEGIDGNFAKKGQCDHCGARFMYVTMWRHKDGALIAVGETCAQERFSCDDRMAYDLKREKEQAREDRKRLAAFRAARDFFPGSMIMC